MDLFSKELQPVTEEIFDAWKRYSYRFRCYFCGHKFKITDKFRAVFTNDMHKAGGNPLVCEECNKPNDMLRLKWRMMHIEAEELKNGKLWWFFKQAKIEGEQEGMNNIRS